MSLTLLITVDSGPIERAAVDVLVAPFFASDRPLRGPAARVDWRTCGLVSQRLAEARVRGAFGEAVLLAAPGPLRSERVVLLGLGARAGFAEAEWRAAARQAVAVALDLGAGRAGLAVPAEALLGIAAERAAAAAAEEAARLLAERPAALALSLHVASGEAGRARQGIAETARRGGASLRLTRGVDPELPRRARGPAAAAVARGSAPSAGRRGPDAP